MTPRAPRPNLQRAALAVAFVAALASAGCSLISAPAQHSVAAPPKSLGAENVAFASASGSTIHAWFARGRAGAGAVLLLHGIGADRTSMRARALFLHKLGFTVLAPDFQAEGESSGAHVTYGALESFDAAAAMRYLRAHVPSDRIGVIGVSMGGAASLLGDGPLPADAFVFESVYPTIRQAVSNRLGTWLGPVGGIARSFTSAAIGLIREETGVTESELQPIAHIGQIHAPLLLISGTADPYTPIAEAESLYARAPEPKSFWAVPGATHEDMYAYETPEYERRVGAFLEEYLRPAPTRSAGVLAESPRSREGSPVDVSMLGRRCSSALASHETGSQRGRTASVSSARQESSTPLCPGDP